MKRGILIVLIFVCLIVLGALEQNFIDTTFNNLKTKTFELQESINLTAPNLNIDNNFNLLNDIQTFWDEKESFLCLITNHQFMEDVNIYLTSLKTSLKYNNEEKANEEVNQILKFIDTYEHIIKINMQNII